MNLDHKEWYKRVKSQHKNMISDYNADIIAKTDACIGEGGDFNVSLLAIIDS